MKLIVPVPLSVPPAQKLPPTETVLLFISCACAALPENTTLPESVIVHPSTRTKAFLPLIVLPGIVIFFAMRLPPFTIIPEVATTFGSVSVMFQVNLRVPLLSVSELESEIVFD